MFCPQCRCEFQVGFTRCNDCDVELVERLEAEPGEPNAPGYVVIATVTGPVEESQICSFLEANGIPTQVRGDSRKSHSLGSSFMQILVPPDCVIAARELLAKADRGDLLIEEAGLF